MGAVIAMMKNITVATWSVGRLFSDLVWIPVAAIAESIPNICFCYHILPYLHSDLLSIIRDRNGDQFFSKLLTDMKNKQVKHLQGRV